MRPRNDRVSWGKATNSINHTYCMLTHGHYKHTIIAVRKILTHGKESAWDGQRSRCYLIRVCVCCVFVVLYNDNEWWGIMGVFFLNHHKSWRIRHSTALPTKAKTVIFYTCRHIHTAWIRVNRWSDNSLVILLSFSLCLTCERSNTTTNIPTCIPICQYTNIQDVISQR